MPSIAQIFAPGAVVAGRYRIEALIGQGGFGAVFRATQLNLDRAVALKVLLPDVLGDEGVHRFQREAELVQRIEHPNVVRLFDFGVAEGSEPYLVFELLQGRTLDEALRAEGPMDPARAARVAAQILKGLMAAHARGIVHRDIKPANVFLSDFSGERDFVKLLDFGIAKGADSRTLTQRGGVLGTPAYMAPEQVTGGAATFATDLYALGLVIEEALTGTPVFRDVSLVDIVREHLSVAAVPHAAIALQSPLGPVIHRATQKAPERRYPSAAEMLAHVEAVIGFSSPGMEPTPPMTPHLGAMLTAQPVLTPASSPSGPLVPPAPARPSARRRRARWPYYVAAGGAAIVTAGVVAAVSVPRATEQKKPPAAEVKPPAADGVEWFALFQPDAIVEAPINADGLLDFVGFCKDETASLCAVDGATFRTLWRRPIRADRTMLVDAHLAVTGRALVFIDGQGEAHVYDLASGAEQGTAALPDKAIAVCTARDQPGKVWVIARDGSENAVDVASRRAIAGRAPGDCASGGFSRLKPCENHFHPRDCPLDFLSPEAFVKKTGPFLTLQYALADGAAGVGFGHKGFGQSPPLAVGYALLPGNRSTLRWQTMLGPGDGQSALKLSFPTEPGLSGGRAAAAYEDTAGRDHVVVLDASSGRRLWDEPVDRPTKKSSGGATIGTALHLAITPTRVYLLRAPRLEVRDAATGRVLGSVGAAEE
jgi:serine/threonine-protein kinase